MDESYKRQALPIKELFKKLGEPFTKWGNNYFNNVMRSDKRRNRLHGACGLSEALGEVLVFKENNDPNNGCLTALINDYSSFLRSNMKLKGEVDSNIYERVISGWQRLKNPSEVDKLEKIIGLYTFAIRHTTKRSIVDRLVNNRKVFIEKRRDISKNKDDRNYWTGLLADPKY